MLKDFQSFILRGNVVDLAVGIIVGTAFGAVVKSLVSDIVMPPLGVLMGGAAFKDLYVVIKPGSAPVPPGASLEAARETGAAVMAIGSFVDLVVNLLVVGFAMFVVVRMINRMREAPKAEAKTKECPECLSKIPAAALRCAHCAVLQPSA